MTPSPTKFATALRAFFAQHLPLTRGLSPRTVLSYRDSFVLLLRFLATRHGCGVVDLELQHLRAGDVLAFLEYLETERKNSVATRNARLAAIHAFARFLATRDPEPVEECQRLLAVPAVTMAYTLRYIDRFLASCRATDLTRETFTAWSESMTSLHSNTRLARLRAVYHLCLFRQREHPHSFVPDPTQFPLSRPRLLPYIFPEAEIVRLLITAEALAPHKASPLHCEVARVGIVILYTTGLRRGELVRLTLSDYEQAGRVFRVRCSKFDKSRLVPLSADTARELDRYLATRRQAGAPRDGDAPLLVHNHGARFRGYTGAAFGSLLRKVIRAAGIRTPQGRAPRVHDLRFTFAVQALLRWYRSGVDVQARLPALATYLGHASVVSTQYYLTFLQATAEAANERFHTHSADWLFPSAVQGGRR